MPKDSEMRTTNFHVDRKLWKRFKLLCLDLEMPAKKRLALLIKWDVEKHEKNLT